ncbi:MAG: hypothetical protein E6J56_10850 [Deltaproteobacteria bacterium]|nr:MAG: hypothetical protein E6J56_10850 [Deltaproteobacteria bacterium]
MPADLRLLFVGVTDDAEREWRGLTDGVAPPLARQLQAQGVKLTTERVRLDTSCDVAALRRIADGALWVVVLGNAYGVEASMDQCRAASVTADRTPSALDLVVRQIALAPGRRGVTVHVRELPPGAAIDRRLLALRAHADRWGDGGRAERYCVAPDLPPAEAIQPWLEQLCQALTRLLAARGLRVGEVQAAEVATPAKSDVPTVGSSVRVSAAPPVRHAPVEESPLPGPAAAPPATAAVSDDPPATSTVRPGPAVTPQPVIEENAPRSNPATPAFEEKPAPGDSWTAAKDERARSAPEPPPPPPPQTTAPPPTAPARPTAGLRATGTLLLIAALVMVALWLKAAGSGTPWLAVVALTFGVSGSLVLRAAGRRR